MAKWEKEFFFPLTRNSPRYECLLELEAKLESVFGFIDKLNRNNENETKLGIEICKLAISCTDKVVEFFGFADGNTPEPINFDQAYETINTMLLKVQEKNVEFNYYRSQENQKNLEYQHDQLAHKYKPQIITIDVNPSLKIQLDESRLLIIYKDKAVFLESAIKFKLFKILCINHGQPVDYKTLFNSAWGRDLDSSFEKTDNNNLARKKLELTKLLPEDLKIKIESQINGTYVLNFF